MKTPNVLTPSQINWYDDDKPRLSYQMLFEELEETEEEVALEDKLELENLLIERDAKWKNKLKTARDKSFEDGYEKGYALGIETAREEIDAKLQLLRTAIEQGHEEWKARQNLIEAGILDLAFDITESILGIPVENEEIRKHLEEKLVPILQMLDEQSRPLIKVSADDYEYVKMLKEEHASKLTVHINVDENCNPGEFELDTQDETIVHKFKEMLKEFKQKLTLPTWK